MHRLLQLFEPQAVLTGNIWGVLWAKLAFAAMLFASSLNDDGMAGNFGDPAREAAFVRLGREVLMVARARGIVPQAYASFDPAAFVADAPPGSARTALDALAARRRHAGKTHSGFWRDLAVRKRRTEVDPLLGTVAALARESGLATPALDTLIRLVHDIEDGRRKLTWDTFGVLLDQCERLSPTISAAQ
jgi:2-dehydropantoate 2-reductase